jgi:acetyl esterase/lipase
VTDSAFRQSFMTGEDLLALPQPPADATIAYGPGPSQKAELRLPPGPGPHPVVVVVHGGCWRSTWGFDHVRALAAALAREGYATWSLEYRRLGEPGGGWPGTLADAGRGVDHLRALAASHRLDLGRVIALGHSAGGQLALWLASRARRAPGSPLRGPDPMPLRGVVALAAVTDLEAAAEAGVCGDAAAQLLDGPPATADARAGEASPIRLLPLGVPQRLLHGRHDRVVPLAQSLAYETAARAKGDDATLQVIADAGHFELASPESAAWPHVRDAVEGLVARPAPGLGVSL